MFQMTAIATVLYLLYWVLGQGLVSQSVMVLTMGGAFVASLIYGLMHDA